MKRVIFAIAISFAISPAIAAETGTTAKEVGQEVAKPYTDSAAETKAQVKDSATTTKETGKKQVKQTKATGQAKAQQAKHHGV